MALTKLPRSCGTPPGWRLATVEEAENNLEWVKRYNLLEEWDRARLLDGWIGGSGYNFHVQVGFRSCLGYMLIVEPPASEIFNTDDRGAALYSKVSLTKKGKIAALFLCCEDWNYEVLHWLVEGEKEEGHTSSVATSVGDETKAASELVSAVARELHSVRAKSRVPKTDFSRDSMRAMTIDIQKSLGSKIKNSLLNRALFFTEIAEISNQCWEEMGLTKDLRRFKDFGFDTSVTSTWEAVADTVWYAMADTIAVAIVAECCKVHNRMMMSSDPLAERKILEDRATVASLVPYAQRLLNRTFYGPDSLWKFVKEAAIQANGDVKRFNELFRDRGYGAVRYDGKYDVLNVFLVQAAKKGDVNLVGRLIGNGIKPSETDDNKRKTALHHAAKLEDECKGLEIAEMLLTEKGLANKDDYKKRTPLHRAALCGHARMCELLLHHNASVTSTDVHRQTPLHHSLLSEQQNEEVVRLLISAEEGSTHLLDVEDNSGKTPLDFAIDSQVTNVRRVTWLLSMSSKPRSYFKKLHLPLYLRESSRMGYQDLVRDLLKEGADPLDPDDEGKTSVHYAAEGANDKVAHDIILELLFDEKQQSINVERATARDKYGRNVLHFATFLGHHRLCDFLLQLNINVDTEDRDGQSAIYYAVAGAHDNNDVLDMFIFTAQGTNQVFLKDGSQTTPLHVAAARGNQKMVKKLISKRVISGPERKNYVGAADVLGQTALHKAASGGHKQIVKTLLEEGARPLEERDSDGKTALHYAAQAENGEDAVAIAKLLLDKCESDKHRSLLLFASAVGIGSAEKSLSSSLSLMTYLAEQKREIVRKTGSENLLRVAATLGNIDMTRELLTRGANITDISSQKWRDKLSPEERENVGDVLKQIDKIVEQGTDKPALWDSLGRSAFANGLAALFLNPFVKSPITVGITGEWGMGKSSLMVQTECILIQTAAQLAFTDSFRKKDFPGATEYKLSAEGEARRRKITHALKRLPKTDSVERLSTTESVERERKPVLQRSYAKKWHGAKPKARDPLFDFLENYQPKYPQIYKSLAVMDRHDMFEQSKDKEEENGSRNQSLGEMPLEEDSMQGTTPSILTVRYNAWQYRNESEAWAGLAVEITKELEATLTVAQKLRTSWRYNWRTRRNSICFTVILPCFLALLVAIWFTTIIWLLLERAQNKDIKGFKYGCLPVSVIAAAWGVGKSVMSFVKPISSQVVDYICLPDHSHKLGYHQKVISDINFLKDELFYRPSWLWRLFAFIWCYITFSWDENYVPETTIPKMPPAFKDNLRIVVFVDDLDRCQENVILQILSAVHLVLATCEINVIMGMDKSMIERAIIRKFGDKNSKPISKSNQDLADKYLRKIIQLPLDLPDPSDSESQIFLQGQLGMWDARKRSTDPAKQTEIHRKVSPKYQIGTSIPKKTKPARVETMNSLIESGAKEERTWSFSDMAQREFVKTERPETVGKPAKGSGVKEANIEIAETTDIEQGPAFKLNKPGENEQGAGARKQRKDGESERRLKELSSITTEMLIPKYSEGERSAFCFLHSRSTRSRKVPREWKCLMTYHRLAWNILSRDPKVISLSGWQVQLIAWVFVCWQWKHLVTTLVQNWHDLEVLRKWVMVQDIQKGEVIEENNGPSLREIVEHYMDEKWPSDKKSVILEGDNPNKKKEDTIDNANEKVGVKYGSSTEEVEKTSGNLIEKNIRKTSCEDTKGEDYLEEVLQKVLKQEREKKRGHFLKIKGLQRSKKGKRKHIEQDDLEGRLKLVLQVEYVKDMLKVIIKEALKEEKERDTQLRDAPTSYVKENKGESSLQQGTTVEDNQKGSHKARENNKNKAKDEEEREQWRKLKETLSRYNVSMDGIQAFQKFRFYCEPGHLPWPLPKQA